jgi:hypothetical protein
MLNPSDLSILESKGISESTIREQLLSFETGFPFLHIISAASPEKGILIPEQNELENYLSVWNNFLLSDATVLKFVPASGAASRMFKDLFEFLEADYNTPVKKEEIKFFEEISRMAFYDALNQTCLKNEGTDIPGLIKEGNYKKVVGNLLLKHGLNYGSLPKGLLQFHSYTDEKRTPVQEHLVEGALYAKNKNNEVNIHFTVSSEHRILFLKHIENILQEYEKKHGVHFNIGFSEQKPSTDTIAADENNLPFRDNGELVFRPGGHGALIENLNDLDADVIFIKNIDNVVPDNMKDQTVLYKKILAGILIDYQKKCFDYLREMENNSLPRMKLMEIAAFSEFHLNNYKPWFADLDNDELRQYLIGKLNRPIRVCGMVKNTGEPGGGPFLTVNQDQTYSTQILESSQIDLKNPVEKEKMMSSTHFNPVDLVCGVKNYQGEKFDLVKYVDKNTGFISLKSKNGKELKALELPGLWNGAMSDWNTIFVEVPIETFNPVKTVNDLLRPEHQ